MVIQLSYVVIPVNMGAQKYGTPRDDRTATDL